MMRTATKRGWIAVCMNLRGQDGRHQVKNATPRGYNAGYTGDLRGVVQQIQHRLKRKEDGKSKRNQFNNTVMDDHDDDDMYIGGPIFLLGYSLGANIITKYLGEESLHGTLPKCIGGGAGMGNPLHINSGSIRFPWNMVLGAGVKKSILQNFSTYKRHHDPGFQSCFTKALFSSTIGELDDTVAPYIIRNDSHPPYTPRIGFKDGKEYWWDSSSHRYVAHVSVPLLKISAQDDFLVFGQFARKMNHCMENPNVLVVKTRCGGHLGWQESPPPSKNGKRTVSSLLRGSGSWSDVAVADFIEAVMQLRNEDRRMDRSERMQPPSPPRMLSKL
jgi:predicted alpha/beta-fold hydrolase